jgi:hypothetical protein
MLMKEDHLNKGQLKPADNGHIGTENHSSSGLVCINARGIRAASFPTGTPCSSPLQQQLGRLPQTIVADVGYDREDNYAYLDKHRRTAVVQFHTDRRARTKKWQAPIQRADHETYAETTDAWVCPAEKRLSCVRTKEETTDSGYVVPLREYPAHDCPTGALRDQCTQATYRSISVSSTLLRSKQQVRDPWASESGAAFMKRRGIEVESVCGQIKEDRRFRRFLLRGLDKVTTE